MEHWAYIEADFQREYKINLVKEIRNMNWRRFLVLLKGLSPNSLWFSIVKISEQIIENPQEAERAVDAVWKF